MLHPKDEKSFDKSNAYIKDGRLLKYRWYDGDIYSVNNYFHHKARRQDKLTLADMNLILELKKVVIEENGKLHFHCF